MTGPEVEFELQREAFQRWMVGLSDEELMTVGKDLYAAMEYRRSTKQFMIDHNLMN